MPGDLPRVPWEPQVPRLNRDQQALLQSAADDTLAEELRRRGYVVYKKHPRMRGGKVTLPNGTVLVQTTLEEAT